MAERTDTLVVGAGPIGLELAAALKGAGVDYRQVDAGQIGHTMSWWAPQTRFFSSPERIAIAGVPLVTLDQSKPTREEYLAHLRGVVEQFDLKVATFRRVVAIEREGPADRGGFKVRTVGPGGDQTGYLAARVVLAIGDMHRARRLGIPGEDLRHVSHFLGEPHGYFRRRVLIIGGRNSAVEAAIRLHRVGAAVAIAYRRERFDSERIKYWLLPEIEGLIKHGAVGWYPCTVPVEIVAGKGDGGGSEGNGGGGGVRVRSLTDGRERIIEADCVLALTGYEQDPALFEACGVELVGETRAPRHNPATMETNVPGIFVAGTATAGTQNRFRVFIETSHVHVKRIVRAITGNGGEEEGPQPDAEVGVEPEN